MQQPGGGPGGQSLQDMQRFQQQLQAQLRQQQQQQQLGGNPQLAASLQPQNSMNSVVQQHGNSSGLRQMQQQQLGLGSDSGHSSMANLNNRQSSGSLSYANFGLPPAAALGVSNTLDASSGSSARLMAMAGLAGNNANAFLGGMASSTSGMGGTSSSQAQHQNIASTNSSGSALQNMQAVLLQQQRQQQQRQQQAAKQLGSQQQGMGNTASLIPGLSTNLNAAQHQALLQSKLGEQATSAAGMMGMQGANLTDTTAVASGTSATAQQQQQQQLLFQQQLAALQATGGGNVASTAAMAAAMQSSLQQQQGNSIQQLQQQKVPLSDQNILQARQQALLQQMEQQQRNNSGNNLAVTNGMLQQIQQQQQHRGSGSSTTLQQQISNSSAGLMGMMQQPPQLPTMLHQQTSGQSQNSGSNNMRSIMGSNYPQQQQALMGQNQTTTAAASGMMDNSNHGSSDGSVNNRHLSNRGDGSTGNVSGDASSLHRGSSTGSRTSSPAIPPGGASSSSTTEQKSFLDGRFAGGWQSNADLPDRRRVIFNILEVIRQMRPDTSKLSNKLPHMAKSLEEHLYRSAKSKEEYMDLSTLKKRLQAIAHGLEIHRTSDSSGARSDTPASGSGSTGAIQQNAPYRSTSLGSQGSADQTSNWSATAGKLQSNAGGAPNNLGDVSAAQQLQTNMAAQMASLQHQQLDDSNDSSRLQSGPVGSLMAHQAVTANSQGNQMGGFGVLQQQQRQQPASQWSSGQNIGGTGGGLLAQSVALKQQQEQQQLSSLQMNQQIADASVAAQNLTTAQNLAAPPMHTSQRQSTETSWSSSVLGSTNTSTTSSSQDPTPSQKRKVIRQQQQRLLLLRHASKCKAGPNCKTKFCGQMVTLWRHMKTCRDKNCKTSHCVSSRCVLNHYRICKSEGKMSSCEVCGPVMIKIKQQERDDGSGDPLTQDQETAAQQPLQSGVSAVASSRQPQATSELGELQQLQAQQTKLKSQLDSLKLLQRQQEELLEQQKSLEQQAQNIRDLSSPQARQLQEQQLLLQELQKRCQQQQLLVQQELQMQSAALNETQSQHTESMPQPPIVHADVVEQPSSQPKGQFRRASGKGKHFGKSLVRQGSQKNEDQGGRNKRGSHSSGSDPLPKKWKSASKPSAAASLSRTPARPTTSSSVDSDETSSVAYMTREEIQKHLDSLNKRIILSSRTVTHKCRPVLQELLDDQFGWVFRDAVDPVALGLPDYFDVVKNPMHLDLVRKKLENAIYSDMEAFARDTRLVFENAILYNGESSEVGELAQSMLTRFSKSYNAVVQEIESSHLNLESQGELCSLCGVQKRRFEPTVLYCQGRCGMQRIKRNAAYYTDRTKQNHWCQPCFEVLDPTEPIILDDGTEVQRKELQEFKNDALPEEGWVNCDECQSWVHQICALFNGRTNKSSARFTCPNCYLKKLSEEPTVADPSKKKKVVKGAGDLVRCKMSDEIEKGIGNALNSAYAARAAELGVTVDQVEKVEGLTVRVLSNVEKQYFVGDKMLERYSKEGCPRGYPVRSKCVALFQKIHGVDALLFAMYVYEYGHECPAPNRRRVYISYLDSVQYFEPKCYRTTVYHAILVEYLRYVKERGFHTAHIWSCPPTPGDDYIFYCHPKHQLVPREDMLRDWYHKMLGKAKAQGVVIRTTTLYDEYFTEDSVDSMSMQKSDPTCLPYFEGDYIPGEIENIIKNVITGNTATSDSPKDSVMFHLGHNLNKMKDNFIVVHLRNRKFAAAVERGDDVSQWKEDSDDDMVRSKRAKISAKGAVDVKSLKEEKAQPTLVALYADETNPVQELPVSTQQEKVSDVIVKDTQRTGGLGSTSTLEEVNNVAEMATTETSLTKAPVSSTGSTSNTDGAALTDEAKNSGALPPSAEKDDSTPEPKVSDSVDQQLNERDTKSTSSKDPEESKDSRNDCSAKAIETTPSKILSESDQPAEPAATSADVSATAEVTSDAVDDASSKHSPGSGKDCAGEVDGGAPANNARASELKSIDEKSETEKLSADNSELSKNTKPEPSSLKRGLDEIGPAVSRHFGELNRSSGTVNDTSDVDPPLESEMFESRQQFLNYCQTTHCQFDELRRAKHSSLMVLFQLHNPTAPKFLQQCGACYRDITHGLRYHCQDCSNFDLCQECYEPVTSGSWAKRDARFAHDSKHKFMAIDMEATEESQTSREERLKSLKAHVKLLEHAGTCEGAPNCSLHNCERMKKLFIHVSSCDVRPKRDCKICTRLLALCTMHSRMCTVNGTCPIPFCDRIRERNERLRRQQQLMDDRRRQAQNELYHAGGEA